MGSFSNYLENKLLDHTFGGSDFVRPATLYVAAFSSAPGAAGGGTELSGNGYVRKAVTNNATNWPAAAGGVKGNGAVIEFAAFTGGPQTVVALGIYDAASAGNLLVWDDVTTPKTYESGDIMRVEVNSVTITLD